MLQVLKSCHANIVLGEVITTASHLHNESMYFKKKNNENFFTYKIYMY